ncbi:MAG: bifunctional DNA-formamidopyrimidine glycosylase/DNA-(apurinic or apyrimidinic site) lyase [Polyangiales bacterium]
MPELPEVEHTRRTLDRWLRGAHIVAVHAPDAFIIRPTSRRVVERRLAGRTVAKVERRGKWIRLEVDSGARVFVHLGMTGWFEPSSSGAPALRFERFALDLAGKRRPSRVAFVDPRRWGRFVLAVAGEDTATWRALGPDPLTDGIDAVALHARLQRRKRTSIKEGLLDQVVLAGIGNIQASEALWKAQIDPRSPASALALADVRRLTRALHWTITRTLRDLAKSEHSGPPESRSHNPFKVYGRRGEPCSRCGRALARIQLGGRTTTYCPGCQRRLGPARTRKGSA